MKDYFEKSLLDSPKAVKFLKKFKLKRIVAGRGHDAGGLIADVYLKSKQLVAFHDDGWGGEPELNFINDGEQILKKAFDEINFAQEIFDNGYGFMGSPDKIYFDMQVSSLVEILHLMKEQDKVMRKTKNKLIFGDNYKHSIISWKGLKSLADLPLTQLQASYDMHKADFKYGDKFFNSKEQLLNLGVKL